MKTVGIAIVCKTPQAGASKTRLSPSLTPEECRENLGCFIRDVCETIRSLAAENDVTGVALYTPAGSEFASQRICPQLVQTGAAIRSGFR